MAKRTKDLGTPTVIVRFCPITPEQLAENRRNREIVASAVFSRMLGFSVTATTYEDGSNTYPCKELHICHGEEIVYPNRTKPEDLPEWAIDAINTTAYKRGESGNSAIAEDVI